MDAVIDIVGTCAAVERLQVDRVVWGPVPVGSGTVATAHGILPVPPPAVAWLLRGVPIASHGAEGEMATPFGPIPVKAAAFAGLIVSAKPEHDACLAAAHLAGVSLAAVVDAARTAGPRIGSPWEP